MRAGKSVATFFSPRLQKIADAISYEDRFWREVAEFLKKHRRPGEAMIAPEEFSGEFAGVHDYAATFGAQAAATWAWCVVHKGLLDRIDRSFLAEPKFIGVPVFANEVFVVSTHQAGWRNLDVRSRHYSYYLEQLAALRAES